MTIVISIVDNLGEIILKKRKKLKLTQAEMADRLDVSQVLIGQYERNRQKPKAEFYTKWIEVFKEPLGRTNVFNITTDVGELTELIIQLQARLNVVEPMLASLASKIDKTSLGAVISEMNKVRSLEADRLFDEYARKVR